MARVEEQGLVDGVGGGVGPARGAEDDGIVDVLLVDPGVGELGGGVLHQAGEVECHGRLRPVRGWIPRDAVPVEVFDHLDELTGGLLDGLGGTSLGLGPHLLLASAAGGRAGSSGKRRRRRGALGKRQAEALGLADAGAGGLLQGLGGTSLGLGPHLLLALVAGGRAGGSGGRQ